MTQKEKEKFQRKAKEDIARYEKEMAEYEKTKREYDHFIDEIHDKGYLTNLEDNRHVLDMSIIAENSANKRVIIETFLSQHLS